MKQSYRIVFTGCKDTTFECISSLLQEGIKIDLLITIAPSIAKNNKVAGYMNLNQFAKSEGIEIYNCDSYSLNSEKDKKKLGDINIDLMLVIGWQRLIPEWLLKNIRIGAFGMHGSSKALPFGRGRSPMNWSIIQDKELFITNLFQYKPGIDDGDILATQIFDINPFDNCKTLHYKNTLSMIRILQDNIDNILDQNFTLKKQSDAKPSYYPKRKSEDGIIFWNETTKNIYNLIRAVTRPFPGAFTYHKKTKIHIWSAQPFDTRLYDPYLKPGLILHVFRGGDFIVKTGDSTMIIQDYDIKKEIKLKKGNILNSANYTYKNNFIYPEEKN